MQCYARDAVFLCSGEFIFFEDQMIAYINTEWKQSQCDLGYDSAIDVFYIGIVAAYVNNSAMHSISL